MHGKKAVELHMRKQAQKEKYDRANLYEALCAVSYGDTLHIAQRHSDGERIINFLRMEKLATKTVQK